MYNSQHEKTRRFMESLQKEPEYIDFEKLEKEKEEYYKTHPDTKPDSLIYGWCMYIFVMIAGLIFNDYWIIALFATIYFFWWRHDQIERENGRRYDD